MGSLSGDKASNWQGGLQEGICNQCNSTFMAPKWELKKKEILFERMLL
jgi:hypothetical protein